MKTLNLYSLIVVVSLAQLYTGCSSFEAEGAASGTTDLGADTGGEIAEVEPVGCEPVEVASPAPGFFADISVASGIQAQNFDPDPPAEMQINDHSRLGFVDLNGDGFDDIVMHSLYPNPMNGGIPFEHLVFLNEGDGTFTHFSDESGLRDVQAGFFAFGDVDNDGDQDCFAGLDIPLAGHTHAIYLNDGQGRFERLPSSGIEGRSNQTVAGNAVFADFDGDAYLDLFVGNGHTSFAAADQLFLGNGDGTFVEASSQLEGNAQRPSNGSVACDYDDDGDLDIFVSVYGVSHEEGHNLLFENDGGGGFVEVGAERGFAWLDTGNYALELTGFGTAAQPADTGGLVGSNGFGLQCEDVNSDGHLDLYVTAISHPVASDFLRAWSDPTALLINGGPEANFRFENGFLAAGLPFNEGDIDGAIVDFDNDGLLDLSTSRDDKYEGAYGEGPQKAWFGLYRQRGTGTFDDVGLTSGINDPSDVDGWDRMKRAQNHAWSDIDRDGDLDLLVGGRTGRQGRPNFLFENRLGSAVDWIAVELEGDGVRVNRDAIGTRVTLELGDHLMTREVRSSRGTYNSMDTRVLHFGLGRFAGCGFEVVVRWPDGQIDVFGSDEIGRNAFVRVRYGEGLVVE